MRIGNVLPEKPVGTIKLQLNPGIVFKPYLGILTRHQPAHHHGITDQWGQHGKFDMTHRIRVHAVVLGLLIIVWQQFDGVAEGLWLAPNHGGDAQLDDLHIRRWLACAECVAQAMHGLGEL